MAAAKTTASRAKNKKVAEAETPEVMPDFRKGAEAAKEAAKRIAFSKTGFLSIGEDKPVIVRFLNDPDEWITVDQHNMVPTKPSPKGFKGNWPGKMGAVCRYDQAFSHIYGDCYIDDELLPTLPEDTKGKDSDQKSCKAKPRTWALAVLREEVREDGKLLGYRDQTREVQKEGDTNPTVEKAYVICNFAYDNFFGPLASYAGTYGTLLNRDYLINREGKGRDTEYRPVPLDPIPAKNPETEEMETFDLRKDYFMARYEDRPELWKIVADRTSDEFYGRFFDVRVTIEETKDNMPSDQPVPADKVDPEKMKELRRRIRGDAGAAEDDGAEEASEPVAEEPAEEPAKEKVKEKAAAASGPVDLDG